MNPSLVRCILRPRTVEDVCEAVAESAADGAPLAVAGGRHAMGGQQFRASGLLLDMTALNRVGNLDADVGLVNVEAGADWPRLVNSMIAMQRGRRRQWGIRQKQTGADRLTIGGAISANAHGRGLTFKPFVDDIESFVLIDARGQPRTCSRHQNRELFFLAIGGYGLFGVIASVKLRLSPRRKVRRVVRVIDIEELTSGFEQRIVAGFLFGDFQFAIDPRCPRDFLRRGVFSCYEPVDDGTPIPPDQRELSAQQWMELLYLAHADKSRAFELYADHYRRTHGQIYWSDLHQLTPYVDCYHEELDRRLGSADASSEMISELYVPGHRLAEFMREVREDFRRDGTNVIYGTIRRIERDDETFLAWAKRPYACIVFNLHTPHTPEGIERAADAFRQLIDRAIEQDGSYYLTYHRWATRRQIESCYPQMREFLRLKREHDPQERFQSDWYRATRAVMAE